VPYLFLVFLALIPFMYPPVLTIEMELVSCARVVDHPGSIVFLVDLGFHKHSARALE
jgi:hypothetical protein